MASKHIQKWHDIQNNVVCWLHFVYQMVYKEEGVSE